MNMVLQSFARSAVMVPLTVAAYGTVMIGLAWVTLVETGSSARRLLGWAPKVRDIPPLGGPVHTL